MSPLQPGSTELDHGSVASRRDSLPLEVPVSGNSASDRQHEGDLRAADHLPVCPSCSDLCGRLAQVCAGCGTELYPSPTELAVVRKAGDRG